MAELAASNGIASTAAVGHGRELSAGLVGPTDRKSATTPEMTGGVLGEAIANPAVQRIGEAASYGGVRVAGPHLLIEGRLVKHGLDIETRQPVVIRDCVIAAGVGHWGIHVRPGAGPVLIEQCAVLGRGMAKGSAGLFIRGDRVVARRCHIAGFADGVRASAGGLTLTECLIDGLAHRPGDHNDGIQLEPGARNVVIERCRVANRHPQTSAIKVAGVDIRITDCHLAGGGWTLYGGAREGASRVVVTGTIFGREVFDGIGRFGPVTDWSHEPSLANLWRANLRDDGRQVRP